MGTAEVGRVTPALYTINAHRLAEDYLSGEEVDVPVLIVGGGPTGLLAAYMLAQLGVKSLIIEKYTQRLAAPKAHALCPRSLEICRQFQLDTNQMRSIGSPREDAYWVNFVTNLSGLRIGRLPYERMDAEVLDCTPEMIHNIPQPSFEQFVARELENEPKVEIRKGVAFVSCRQDNSRVTSVVEERATKRKLHVKSSHVIACDGARSKVREYLGIETEGENTYETMMTIHFHADLRPVVKERVGMLHWITDPACSGFIIAYELGGNHVLISNCDSRKHPVECWNYQLARETVSAAIGKDIPLEILSFRPWELSRKVAKEYRRGNIFLAGDAAHSFPPTGGLGLNSGIADVHNLAYKIAAVHHGRAGDSLLDSYQSERRQIALVNSTQSVKNGKKIFSFLKTLGTAGMDDVEAARANLERSIHSPEKQEMIAAEIKGQREHFDNLGIHIGYVYGDKTMPRNASDFAAKFVSGARLPHAWITFQDDKTARGLAPVDVSYVKELSEEQRLARQYSILDLCSFDAFTLIVASRDVWTRPYNEAVKWAGPRNIKIQLQAVGLDFSFVDSKQRQLWDRNGLADGGAFLLRPDQHILAILSVGATSSSITDVIGSHLGL